MLRMWYLLFGMMIALLSSCLSTGSVKSELEEEVVASSFIPGYELIIPTGHNWIWSFDISDDSRYLITGDGDGTVKIWDTERRIVIRQFAAHPEKNVRAVSISRDNEILVTSGDRELAYWKAETGSLIIRERTDFSVNDIVFLPGGHQFLVCGPGVGIGVWDLEKNCVVRHFDTGGAKFNRLLPGPSGDLLYAGGMDGSVSVWQIDTGKRLKVLGSVDDFIHDMAVSPDGSILVVTAGQGSRKIWSIPDGRFLAEDIKNDHHYDLVSFSRDGSVILFGSGGDGERNGGLLEGWDSQTFELLWQNHEFKGGIASMVLAEGDSEIILGLENGDMTVWDAVDGRITGYLGNEVSVAQSGMFLGNHGKYFAAEYGDKCIRIWDIENLRLHRTLRGHTSPYIKMAASADGEQLVSGSGYVRHGDTRYDNLIRSWDIETGRSISVSSGQDDSILSLAVSPDGAFRASAADDGSLIVTDRNNRTVYKDHLPDYGKSASNVTGRVVKRGFSSDVHNVIPRLAGLRFSPDGRYFAYRRGDKVLLLETTGWKTVKRFRSNYPPGSVGDDCLGFSGDSSTLAFLDDNNSVIIVSLGKRTESRKLIWEDGYDSMGVSLALSPDGRNMATRHDKGDIRIWHLQEMKAVRIFSDKRFSDYMTSIRYSPDGRFLLTAANGVLVLYSTEDGGGSLCFVAGGDEWLVYDDRGYFDGSSDSGQLMSIAKGLENYRIDQFACHLNRPDLLLSRFGLGTENAVEIYEYLYNKRRKKQGVVSDTPINWSVPIVNIQSVKESEGTAFLNLAFSSLETELADFSVYVNDVPFFTENAVLSGKQDERNIEVPLGNGRNKVEVACRNTAGIESYRDWAYVLSSEETHPSDLYFVGIGVSDYGNEDYNLEYAAKDALDLETLFRSMSGSFADVYSICFTDDGVHRNILGEVDDFLSGAGIDDVVILFIAGHGLYDRDEGAEYYYLVPGFDSSRLSLTTVPFSAFESLLASLDSRRKVFFMDTCESGELDETDINTYRTFADSLGIRDRGVRGLGVRDAGDTEPPRRYLQDNDRFIFNDLNRRSGAIIFSSCRGNELSYESDELENGFFTEAILSAFSGDRADSDSDRSVSIRELQLYVSGFVSELSGGNQNPTIDRDNIYLDLFF